MPGFVVVISTAWNERFANLNKEAFLFETNGMVTI